MAISNIITLLVVLATILSLFAPRVTSLVTAPQRSSSSRTKLYYNYDKKLKDGEKKEIGRLWKNIIFPGIFNEYEDTKEPLKTIKVDRKEKVDTSARDYQSEDLKEGTYNSKDPRTAPVITGQSIKTVKLAPVKKPSNFVAPQAGKSISKGGGINTIPDVSKYPRAKKPLILYEYEASADCKKVREACTMLDLTVEFRPCPGGTSGFSDIMNSAAKGRREVPFMLDSNPSMYKPELFGAKDIISHLFVTYGPGEDAIPANMRKNSGSGATGAKVKPNVRPDNTRMKPITLYGWEGAKPVTPVRQCLNDLSLAHTFIPVSQGSANRAALEKRTNGIFQVPFIIDPNTGIEMFESKEIIEYLKQTYTV